MLKVEGLYIQDEKQRMLLKGASFSLPNQGIVCIHTDSTSLHHALAQVLSGIKQPEAGILHYNKQSMQTLSEEERSVYRSTFVSSLFHNFQILKDKSVYYNVTMGLEYPSDKMEQELINWGLYDKQNILAEDLTTKEQWKMVLLRCVLRQPMMLVFDTQSCPLSSQELVSFYPLLEEIRSQMLVIVIGDQGCYPFSNRIIEIERGYILSDSIAKEEDLVQINHNRDVFQLTRSNMTDLQERMHTFIRWKLRCVSVLGIVAFICLSTAIFSTTLNIIDIQTRLMKEKGSSIVAVEKVAKSNDNIIKNNFYATLHQNDISVLKEKLGDQLVLGYYPVDPKASMFFAYGTTIDTSVKNILDEYTIIEADSPFDIGLKKIVGRYPKNYNEIALSSSQAYSILKDYLGTSFQNSEEQMEEMLQYSVSWYGNTMDITGIFPSQHEDNMNMELDMKGYNGEIETGTMMQDSFYVKKGFVSNYRILQDQVYQKSYKRLIYGNRELSEFQHILTIEHDMYYYDGKEVVNNHDVNEDEVILDFDMALDMGYRSQYLYLLSQENVTFEEMVQGFQNFANEWIGKKVNIQAYSVNNNPISTNIMSVNKKIKGFVIPVSYDYVEGYANKRQMGTAYVNPNAIEPYDTDNVYVKEAFFHTDDEATMKKALSYLNKESSYNAFLYNSTLLKFFVVDLKNLDALLFAMGGISLLVFIKIFVFLIKSSIGFMRDECTIYYLFGEKKSTLKKMMIQYFTSILWMRALFGWLCGTLALGTFILIIYLSLAASSTILYALALPLLLLLVVVMVLKFAFHRTIKKSNVIEEEFMDVE